jgi:hypothetical protein
MKRLRRKGTNLYLSVDIDGGGMSVFWVGVRYAQQFTPAAAESMLKRIAERYPDEQIEVVNV